MQLQIMVWSLRVILLRFFYIDKNIIYNLKNSKRINDNIKKSFLLIESPTFINTPSKEVVITESEYNRGGLTTKEFKKRLNK